MPVTSNGWEDFYGPLVDRVKGVFRDKESEIISNANENPAEVLPLSEDDEQAIRDEYESAVDSTIDKTVDDINDEIDEEGSGISETTITLAKVVGGFFLVNTVKRAYERLHGATIARQTQDDVEQAQDDAITTSENQIDVVSRNELGETYAQTAREQQESKGIERYKWVHSGADHPRQNHLSYDGQIFSWDTPPDEDGFPGEAFNCACYAVPVTDEISNKLDTKIMNKKIFALKQNGDTAELYIHGMIGDYDIFNDEGVVFNDFKRDITEAIRSEKVRIYINSPGGYVYDGYAIYNEIKRLSQNNDIEIHISGLAASMASIIALAVPYEKRYVHDGSIVMIHNPMTCVCGESRDMESALSELNAVTDALARIYSDQTSLSFEAAKIFMDKETYFSPDELQEIGFANIASESIVTAKKSDVEDFLKNIKASCSVEQKKHLKISAKYQKLFNPINQVSEMDLKELQDKLEAEQKSNSELQAKLEADKTALETVKTENKELKSKLEDAEGKIASAKAEALEAAKAELKTATEVMNQAKEAGFDKAEGEAAEEIKRSVLNLAKVSNPESFEGKALDSIFNHVIENSKSVESDEESNEHDEVFNKQKPKSGEIKMFTEKKRGAK